VQASLVLFAIEIRSSELEHGLVVPPEKEADCALGQVCYKYKSPELGAKDVLRCEPLIAVSIMTLIQYKQAKGITS
jgi:hypothetical protein